MTAPAHPRRVVVASLAVMALVVVAGVIVAHSQTITNSDLRGDQLLSLHHSAPLTVLAESINWLFGSVMAIVITVLTAVAICARTRNLRLALTFVGAVAFPYLGTSVVKAIVDRHRPNPQLLAHPLLSEKSFSYPSGHTAFALSITLALLLLVIRRQRRVVMGVVVAVVTVATALSRVYLGVHYPIDVIASVVWSAAAMAFALTLWNRYLLPRTFRSRNETHTLRASGQAHTAPPPRKAKS